MRPRSSRRWAWPARSIASCATDGIRVTTIGPAGTSTEFAMGAGRTEDMPELKTYLKPEDIAFAIRTVLEQPRRLRTQYWTIWSMAQGS